MYDFLFKISKMKKRRKERAYSITIFLEFFHLDVESKSQQMCWDLDSQKSQLAQLEGTAAWDSSEFLTSEDNL